MKFTISQTLQCATVVAALFLAPLSAQSTDLTVTVAADKPGADIPADFIGLSYEISQLFEKDGSYYFDPNNKSLIALLNLLGVKNLRVGGNTADRATFPIPTSADIDRFFAFAKAVDAKVIYTFRLNKGNPEASAELAKHIFDHYEANLSCFAIGNEPNVFAREYPPYKAEWKKYTDAILTAVPKAMFCGPSATPGKRAWAQDFAHDFGSSGHIAFISQHHYPGGNSVKVTDQVKARTVMLSSGWHEQYQKFADVLLPLIQSQNFGYRLEEANSYFNGGAENVSDSYAAALWGADYLHWWATHHAAGINFHTGDSVDAGFKLSTCFYSAFYSTKGGYNALPLAYGMKTFELGSHGKTVPVETEPALDAAHFSVYAVLDANQQLFVTLINKNANDAPETVVHLKAGTYTSGEVQLLAAPGNDLAAKNGLTIGGASIKEDASWNGQWTPIEPPKDGIFTVKVPNYGAAVVRLTTK